MKESYNLICADPAYIFSDSLTMAKTKRGAVTNYSSKGTKNGKAGLTCEELCDLPVKEIAADDSLLFLWVPGSMIEDGLKIVKAWGFEQKQIFVWVKTKKNPLKKLAKLIVKLLKSDIKLNSLKDTLENIKNTIMFFNLNNVLDFNMGRIFRQTHEIAIVATRGKILSKIKDKSQRSVFIGQWMPEHSQKPEEPQDMLEKMFDGKKIELFGRRDRPGWLVLGNQSPTTPGQDILDSLNDVIAGKFD